MASHLEFIHRMMQLDLSPRQALVMELASTDPMLTMSAAAGYLNFSTAAMTGTMDQMVRRGLLSRKNTSQDRRKQFVILTDLGRDMLSKLTASPTHDDHTTTAQAA